MKKLIIVLAVCGLAFSATAQMHEPEFLPDWTYIAPAPGNATYIYVAEHGEGNTKREAINQAIGRVFQSTANRIGQFISTDEINRAMQAGTDYQVISRKMKVPVNKVCEFPVQNPVDYTWTVYVLCQVAKSGNITPEFDPCERCTDHTIYDKKMEEWHKHQQDSIDKIAHSTKRSNARAIAASTFIPGMGQMLKKQGGSGAAFLLSELALFGGGTACYFLGQDQSKKMKAVGTSYDDYKAAKDKKHTYDIVMYSCFGVGAAVHIANMVHAWCVKDKSDKKKSTSMNFIPAIIPINELSQPSYAYGAGVQINF